MVDMLGLEPSALRCAGSSPVPGTLLNFLSKLYIIGNSLTGRASDSESEGWRFESFFPSNSVKISWNKEENNYTLTYVINLPTYIMYSEVAQSVEQVAVNHWVIGSSPILGELLFTYS